MTAFNALLEQRLATVSNAEVVADAFAIAAEYDRTVYDAVYVALAITSGAQLLTADERLVNALAAYFPGRWLGVYQRGD